jgi:hypothetical protein
MSAITGILREVSNDGTVVVQLSCREKELCGEIYVSYGGQLHILS